MILIRAIQGTSGMVAGRIGTAAAEAGATMEEEAEDSSLTGIQVGAAAEGAPRGSQLEYLLSTLKACGRVTD